MTARKTRVSAAQRFRYFSLASVAALGLVLALAVAVGPKSAARPPAAAPAPASASASAAPKLTAAAKLAAEAAGAANPSTETAGEQVLPPQPSWNAPPQVVEYHGYRFQVPGSWPVYHLDQDPAQCVLLNTHAVYLGTPGDAQDCPAAAIGRTEALLVQPASAPTIPGSAVVLPAATAALPEKAALPAAVTTAQQFQVEVPAAGVLVTATYSANEAKLRAILAAATIVDGTSAHAPASGPARPASSSSPKSGSARFAAADAPAGSGSSAASTLTVSEKPLAAAATVRKATRRAAAPLRAMIGSGLGLDTCSVPSVKTMTAWLASPYRVIGTYLGGANWACSYGNFSASWVRSTAAEGWRFIPIWLGRQAACSTIPGVTKISSAPAAEGKAEASSAIAAARRFGYGRGAPIYYDMEGYVGSSGCTRGVLAFLGGWTQALHAAGYASGVYSSAASGIKDLAAAYAHTSYPHPDDVWTANWTGEPVITDSYIPHGAWPNHQRIHQYSGPHNEKWGGAALDIDSDATDGLVVGASSAPDSPRPVVSAQHSEMAVAPGHPARMTLTMRGAPGSRAQSVQWRASLPRGISARPASGTVHLGPKNDYSVTVSLRLATTLKTGRYLVPVTLSAGSHAVANAFVLVTVLHRSTTVPTRYPLVLYAADSASMAVALSVDRALGLPPGSITGSFTTAWNDVASGRKLVLAVGDAAASALYFNDCGWTDPAGWRAGSTPFYYRGFPLRGPPGKRYFELSNRATAAETTALTIQLTQYALAGTMPNDDGAPAPASPPALRCLGHPNVRVS